MSLPPDPDGQNDDRASWAQAAIDRHGEATGATAAGDGDCNVFDLMCNLIHWCDRNDISFKELVKDARDMYKEETRDDE